MKHDKSDLKIVLTSLLLLSISIGIIFAGKGTQAISVPQQISRDIPEYIHPFTYFSSPNIFEQLGLLIVANDLSAIAQTLKGLGIEKALDVTRFLIQDDTLSRNKRIKLLFALTRNYPNDLLDQYKLLDLIRDKPALLQGESLLKLAAESPFVDVIPVLIAWSKHVIESSENQDIPQEIAFLAQEALKQSILSNQPATMQILFDSGVQVSNIDLAELLWLVVDANKRPEFIKILVDHGADINYARKGHSTLAKAVDNGNFDLVKAIVETGKVDLKINKSHDPAIGTPLEIAIKKNLTQIDEYLREHGAREKINEQKVRVQEAK